jgi:hypothetical protein
VFINEANMIAPRQAFFKTKRQFF